VYEIELTDSLIQLQSLEELPSCTIRARSKKPWGQTIARPIERIAGVRIESIGTGKQRVIVIATDGELTALGNQIDAWLRVRAIANDITQAENTIDLTLVDVGKDRSESFNVAMNVGNDSKSHELHPAVSMTPSANCWPLGS
jgi:hypothetical protein